MSTYPQRVAENILPLSVAGTLPEAFSEWAFTERTEDHGHPTETCHLCEQESLRYHFEIENGTTKKRLWVGSQCILKFGVSVLDGGRKLAPAEAKRKLDRLMDKMRLDSCVRALENLAQKEDNQILKNALAFYQKHKYLTPKFAFVVLWRLEKNNIDHSPSFFKINLQRYRFQVDLRRMDASHLRVIWPALSSSQRAIAISYGHSTPPPVR